MAASRQPRRSAAPRGRLRGWYRTAEDVVCYVHEGRPFSLRCGERLAVAPLEVLREDALAVPDDDVDARHERREIRLDGRLERGKSAGATLPLAERQGAVHGGTRRTLGPTWLTNGQALSNIEPSRRIAGIVASTSRPMRCSSAQKSTSREPIDPGPWTTHVTPSPAAIPHPPGEGPPRSARIRQPMEVNPPMSFVISSSYAAPYCGIISAL